MKARSIATIFYIPETGCYGFRYQFVGHKRHYVIDTCPTLQAALDHCDAHREHIWEDARDVHDNAILVAGIQEGTVMWRITHLTLAGFYASETNRFSKTRRPVFSVSRTATSTIA